MAINDLSISFPDFKLNDKMNPDEFDTNNKEIVDKINDLIGLLNILTDSTEDSNSGADNVSVTLISGFTATKLQPLLEEIIAKLTSTTDGISGADYVKATAITGLTGTSVQALIESLKSVHDTAIATANTNSVNAVTTANQANSTAGTANTSATNAVTTANLADSKVDGAVATANLADGKADAALTKASQVEEDYTELKPILEQAVTDVQNAVGSVENKADKTYIDEIAANFVLGEIPDRTITEVKLHEDVVEKFSYYEDEGDNPDYVGVKYRLVFINGKPCAEVVVA